MSEKHFMCKQHCVSLLCVNTLIVLQKKKMMVLHEKFVPFNVHPLDLNCGPTNRPTLPTGIKTDELKTTTNEANNGFG